MTESIRSILLRTRRIFKRSGSSHLLLYEAGLCVEVQGVMAVLSFTEEGNSCAVPCMLSVYERKIGGTCLVLVVSDFDESHHSNSYYL